MNQTKENLKTTMNNKNTITIPLFPDMTREQAQIVIDAVKQVGARHHVR